MGLGARRAWIAIMAPARRGSALPEQQQRPCAAPPAPGLCISTGEARPRGGRLDPAADAPASAQPTAFKEAALFFSFPFFFPLSPPSFSLPPFFPFLLPAPLSLSSPLHAKRRASSRGQCAGGGRTPRLPAPRLHSSPRRLAAGVQHAPTVTRSHAAPLRDRCHEGAQPASLVRGE